MTFQPGLRLPCRAPQGPVSDADEGSVTFHRTLPRIKVTKRAIMGCSFKSVRISTLWYKSEAEEP